MNYIEILKTMSHAFNERTDLTLDDEILFSNASSFIYIKLEDLPEILRGKTFYNVNNLLSILSEKYENISEILIDENNGKLLVGLNSDTKIEILFSYILCQRNKKQKSIADFMNQLKNHNNYYEFDITPEHVADLKKYQSMFKTKSINIVGSNVGLKFLITNADNDKYEKSITLKNGGDFKCDFKITEIPSKIKNIKIVKQYSEKTQTYHYLLIFSNEYLLMTTPTVNEI
jgi:hypothetical protein